ncbi:hypothetical protein FOZ60_002651 [Perkinsus olseni]|uniref:Uncharacterized protein n=1 Tax=Perkinsus olseni TaxID=32597 RepID=A0A7J6NXD3_PEROL|nr:hypothetical protein FOZ60_002651 [Perkinsus olseni]
MPPRHFQELEQSQQSNCSPKGEKAAKRSANKKRFGASRHVTWRHGSREPRTVGGRRKANGTYVSEENGRSNNGVACSSTKDSWESALDEGEPGEERREEQGLDAVATELRAKGEGGSPTKDLWGSALCLLDATEASGSWADRREEPTGEGGVERPERALDGVDEWRDLEEGSNDLSGSQTTVTKCRLSEERPTVAIHGQLRKGEKERRQTVLPECRSRPPDLAESSSAYPPAEGRKWESAEADSTWVYRERHGTVPKHHEEPGRLRELVVLVVGHAASFSGSASQVVEGLVVVPRESLQEVASPVLVPAALPVEPALAPILEKAGRRLG